MKIKQPLSLTKEHLELTTRPIATEGIRKLTRAMLKRAVDDLNHKDTFEAARKWIFNGHEENYAYNFVECCERLGFSPYTMRSKIFEVVKNNQEFEL